MDSSHGCLSVSSVCAQVLPCESGIADFRKEADHDERKAPHAPPGFSA